MNTNKELDKYQNHSEWTDWYLQGIGNVNGLISYRLSPTPIIYVCIHRGGDLIVAWLIPVYI